MSDAKTGPLPAGSVDPETWVAEHGDYLYRYAYVRLRDKATAEDAVQEALLAAFKGKERFDGRANIRYWLLGILKHKIVDHIRKASREVQVEDFDGEDIEGRFVYKAFGIPTANPESWRFHPRRAFEQQEFWGVFETCLGGLRGPLHQAFTLRELEGLKTEEICKVMNITPNNFWVMLHRARNHLKSCLQKNWINPSTSSET